MQGIIQQGRRGFSFTYPCPRKLREIVKLSLFEKETPARIAEIWTDYHNNKPHTVSKILTQSHYLQLLQKYLYFLISSGQNSPMFVFPVPKGTGHFMLLGQNQQKSFVALSHNALDPNLPRRLQTEPTLC